MAKPLIGITLDHETAETYARYPWYALRQNYSASISDAGGIPLLLPYDHDAIPHYVHVLDGLLIPGGCNDIPPHLYGAPDVHTLVTTKPMRTSFEMAIAKAFLDQGKPIFGICGGMQVLAVLGGSTLVQHIPDTYPDGLCHEQKEAKHLPTHDVSVVPGSLLHTIMDSTQFAVNSTHHQAVQTPGPSVVINSQASDGVIEGIEIEGHPFCIGVQWHPEYRTTSFDRRLFTAFVGAAADRSFGASPLAALR